MNRKQLFTLVPDVDVDTLIAELQHITLNLSGLLSVVNEDLCNEVTSARTLQCAGAACDITSQALDLIERIEFRANCTGPDEVPQTAPGSRFTQQVV